MAWRLIRNTRRIGPRWILQKGDWLPPSTVGASKGLNRRFKVAYEEFYQHRTQADEALAQAERLMRAGA